MLYLSIYTSHGSFPGSGSRGPRCSGMSFLFLGPHTKRHCASPPPAWCSGCREGPAGFSGAAVNSAAGTLRFWSQRHCPGHSKPPDKQSAPRNDEHEAERVGAPQTKTFWLRLPLGYTSNNLTENENQNIIILRHKLIHTHFIHFFFQVTG